MRLRGMAAAVETAEQDGITFAEQFVYAAHEAHVMSLTQLRDKAFSAIPAPRHIGAHAWASHHDPRPRNMIGMSSIIQARRELDTVRGVAADDPHAQGLTHSRSPGCLERRPFSHRRRSRRPSTRAC